MNLIALTNVPAAVKIWILPNAALRLPGAMTPPVKGKVLLSAFRHNYPGEGERPIEIGVRGEKNENK